VITLLQLECGKHNQKERKPNRPRWIKQMASTN